MTNADKKALVAFGKLVRRRRQFLRFKQKEIAQKVGINARTQANIEWARHWPSLPVYFKLCAALEMPVTPPFSTP